MVEAGVVTRNLGINPVKLRSIEARENSMNQGQLLVVRQEFDPVLDGSQALVELNRLNRFINSFALLRRVSKGYKGSLPVPIAGRK